MRHFNFSQNLEMYIDVNYVNKPSKLHIFFVFTVTCTEIQLTATNGRQQI